MTNIRELPSVEYLNECFSLNEETGILYWKNRPIKHFNYDKSIYNNWNSRFPGKIAGSRQDKIKEYRRIYIDGLAFKEHRIIFKIFFKEEPEYIDHINGKQSDNRPINLRSVPMAENNRNMPIGKNNKSGFLGVHKRNNKWAISDSGKEIRFNSFDEAVKYKIKLNEEKGYHPNHGRKKIA